MDALQRRMFELSQFRGQFDECRRYKVPACDRALSWGGDVTHGERTELERLLTTARQFEEDFHACKSGTAAACGAALASPAADQSQRAQLGKWRDSLSPLSQAASYLQANWPTAVSHGTAVLAFVRSVPTSTYATILVVTAAALVLKWVLGKLISAVTLPQPDRIFAAEPASRYYRTASYGRTRARNPGVAFLLSFLWSGLGQMYNGQVLKGFIFATSIVGLWWLHLHAQNQSVLFELSQVPPPLAHLLGLPQPKKDHYYSSIATFAIAAGIVLWVVAMIDAYRTAKGD